MMTKENLIESLLCIELAARTQRRAIEKDCPEKITFKILYQFISLIDSELSAIKEAQNGKE